jgi:hypothetical protein
VREHQQVLYRLSYVGLTLASYLPAVPEEEAG